MAADPVGIVRKYWERVWLERDLDALDELVTDPSIRHTSEGTQTLSVADLRVRLADALRALRSESMQIDAFAVAGEEVWVRLTLRAVSLATMTPLAITWLAQYRLEGDRITESWAMHEVGLDWHAG